MLLMAAEVLQLPEVAAHFTGNAFWDTVKFHTSHVEWTGCSIHDLIQPSFSFMVGVALPFSLASRMAKRAEKASLWLHALWRSFSLVMLGVVLRSMGEPQTYWTFEDTLSQIGLGYPFLFALGFATVRVRWLAFAGLLLGYWLLFALYSSGGRHAAPSGWEHDFTGFAAHWNINANAAWAFDQWFLNLLPRKEVFAGNDGGYSTLSFIPTLATMLLGLLAGQWIKDGPRDVALFRRLVMAGVVALAAGYAWHLSGLGPSVKKIWTPSWVLFSGGWCLLLMAVFFWILDLKCWQRWAFPLIVIGTNSIAMYVMSWTLHGFFGEVLTTHFGHAPFRIFGDVYEPLLHGAAILFILWLILWWMHRNKIHIRI